MYAVIYSILLNGNMVDRLSSTAKRRVAIQDYTRGNPRVRTHVKVKNCKLAHRHCTKIETKN